MTKALGSFSHFILFFCTFFFVFSSIAENRCINLFLPHNVVLLPVRFKPPVVHKAKKFLNEVFVAVITDNFSRAEEILKNSNFKYINAINDNSGSTLLHLVAEKFDYSFAEFLLKNGADPNQKNRLGQTPLHIAASEGERSFVELLLANKADINARDDQGNTPISAAIQISFPGEGYVEVFLKHPDLNPSAVNADGQSLVHLALAQNFPDFARELIRLGADVNTADAKGRTALHWAAIREATLFAEFLIKEGADINAKDESGRTPFDQAREEESNNTLILLFKSKVLFKKDSWRDETID